MAEYASTWLLGDTQVEFGGRFLGSGPVTLHLVPEFLAVRRDRMSKLQGKQVTGLSLTVTAALPGPERLLDVLDGSDSSGFTLSDFADAPFASGKALNLYPADPQLRGFAFPAAYLRESADAAGNYLQSGTFTAVFECEANASGTFFTRLAAGSHAAGSSARTFPDLAALSRALVTALATPLQATVDATFSRESMRSGSGNQYALLLRSCGNFQNHAPREIRYELAARGPENVHDTAIARLTAAANFLYGFRPALTGFAPLAGKIENMEFNRRLTVQGQPFRESRLAFVLFLA